MLDEFVADKTILTQFLNIHFDNLIMKSIKKHLHRPWKKT